MHTILIVPPFSKSTSGPPLGPAMLAGAARAHGHEATVVDLAIEEIRWRVPSPALSQRSGLAGDHDKNEPALRVALRDFFEPAAAVTGIDVDRLAGCKLAWAELDAAVHALAATPWGARVHERLRSEHEPHLIGVSVMYAEQVLAALVVTAAARRAWPNAPVVWGGAHVTALAPEISDDARYGHGIDGFIAGYAERTFVELLSVTRDRRAWPAAVFSAGSGTWRRANGDLETTPLFPCLDPYGAPRLTVPAQVTRGCAYGKCGFCTYPFVEGDLVRPAASLEHLEPVIAEAAARGAVVAFKDALMTPPFLRRVSALVRGRTPWAACTSLNEALPAQLPTLAAAGCETLEVGIETLVDRSLRLIDKKASRLGVEGLLRAAQRAGVRIVVNYMTGLPGENERDAADCYRWIQVVAAATGAVVEHHTFEAERRAPLTRQLRVTAEWPWSSVVAWEPIAVTEAA